MREASNAALAFDARRDDALSVKEMINMHQATLYLYAVAAEEDKVGEPDSAVALALGIPIVHPSPDIIDEQSDEAPDCMRHGARCFRIVGVRGRDEGNLDCNSTKVICLSHSYKLKQTQLKCHDKAVCMLAVSGSQTVSFAEIILHSSVYKSLGE